MSEEIAEGLYFRLKQIFQVHCRGGRRLHVALLYPYCLLASYQLVMRSLSCEDEIASVWPCASGAQTMELPEETLETSVCMC